MRASRVFEVSDTHQHTYVVGLGANMGEPLVTLRAAVTQLALSDKVEVRRRSGVYRSAAMGPPQPDFLNAAVCVASAHAPAEMLGLLHGIERTFGRQRTTRWGPRTLDLDLLWADVAVRTAQLTVPHIGLTERWWALRPLLDVSPELASTYGPALRKLGQTPAPAFEL